MPDISMCPGDDCPKKIACYRYRAMPASIRQAYFATPPVQSDGTCDSFEAIKKDDRLTTHICITMKDGRTFSGLLDHWDALEEFITLAVDHTRHPEIPEIFLLKNIGSIVDTDSGKGLR